MTAIRPMREGRRLVREGETGVGICERCERRVPTVYRYRDVPLDHPRTVASRVLVAVCEAGHVVSIPWQSNRLLQAARRAALARREEPAKFEARIPAQLEDALRVLVAELGAREDVLRPGLVGFYLHELRRDPALARRVARLVRNIDATWPGPATARLSVPVPRGLKAEALEAARAVGVDDQSALAKGIIAVAWEDVMRPRPGAGARLAGLRAVAAAAMP